MTDNLAEATSGATVDKESAERPEVRFEVGGKPLDLSKVNRVGRRLLEGQAKKYSKKYAGTVGPNGERPTVILRSARLLDRNIQVVLEYPERMKDSVKGHEKAVRVD